MPRHGQASCPWHPPPAGLGVIILDTVEILDGCEEAEPNLCPTPFRPTTGTRNTAACHNQPFRRGIQRPPPNAPYSWDNSASSLRLRHGNCNPYRMPPQDEEDHTLVQPERKVHMASRQHTGQPRIVMTDTIAGMDRRFAEIAISRGYVSPRLCRHLCLVTQIARGAYGHRVTLPELLVRKNLVSLERIDSVLQELFCMPEEPAPRRKGDALVAVSPRRCEKV